jgi:hypothetical protein
MKKLFALTCLFFSLKMNAQNCGDYLFLQNNKTVEMTIYNKKGEPSGKQIYTVSNVSGSGSVITATLNSEIFDKDQKSIAKATNTVQCNNGVMMMDMKTMMPQQQAGPYNNMHATADSVYIEYPPNMAPGDQLKDATMTMEVDNNGLTQSLRMSVTERKVEGKESVTTTAGTWDCYKISFKSKMIMKTAGIGIPINMDGVEWYAAGVGLIKSESKHGGTAITSIK